MATLAAIYRHPVKSLASQSLLSARLDAYGLQHDRRWMLVDDKGRFVTQRLFPQLARVSADPVGDGLVLSEAGESLVVPQPSEMASRIRVQVWGDEVDACDGGDVAADFFGRRVQAGVRLVYMPDSTFRRVDPHYVPAQRQVSFADGFPLLLLSRASVDDLNARLAEPVTERNFRPNLVIEGVSAFAEDTWRRIRIGNIELHCVKPCSRCVMTTVNPTTGQKRDDREPLKTLTAYRKMPDGVMFGQNMVPQAEGVLRVGDTVEVLE